MAHADADLQSDTDQARRWTRVFLGASLGLCSLVALVNFVVNPYGYYPSRWFPPLTWSSREKKLELLRTSPPPAILVLGSSRAMNLAPARIEQVTGASAFNGGVDSARVEDWYAIYGYARGVLALPIREVVIGIDIEAFHDHLEPDARLLSAKELRAQLPVAMQWKAAAQAAQGLLGYVHTVDSLRSIALSRSGYPPPPYRIDPDGMIHYTTEKSFDPKNDTSFAEYENRFANFTDLDRARKALFEALLGRAKDDGVRVRAFITPLHAQLVERLNQTRDFRRLHGLLVAYLESVRLRSPNFTFVDFTDGGAFGGEPNGFRDGAHIDDANADHLVKRLWSDRAVQ